MTVLLLPLLAPSSAGWSPTGSVQATFPQIASVSLGVTSLPWMDLWGPGAGLVLRTEPGLGGVKVHAGLRSAFNLFFLPVTYTEVTLAGMYTWNGPWSGLDPGQTYAGLEARYGFHAFLVTVGAYRHLAGDDDSRDWVVSAGAGVGI